MAAIDDLQAAYEQNLGRSASQDELNNWLGGNYGGGGTQDWINQIQNSGEAQSYRQQQAGPPPPTIDWPRPDTNHGYEIPNDFPTPQQKTGITDDFWNQIGGAYQNYLGRDASVGELQNWWTGNYGYGAQGSNMQGMLDAIRNSQEAMSRRVQEPASRTNAPAGVDQAGWDNAFAGLSAVYKNALGRNASPDEINKWLTGAYGYGSGLGDYNKYVNAIMSSQEARNYRGDGTRPDGQADGYKGIEYWQGQGVPTVDIFDPMTGQLKAGWTRTANGYERAGGTTGTTTTTGGTQPIPNNDVAGLLKSLLGTGPSSPQALAAIESQLAKYGIKLQKDSDGTIRGRLFLPNGEAVDVVNANGWGQPWSITNRGKTGPETGKSTQYPSNQYSDAYTALLEQLMKARMSSLQQPVNDPYRAAYMQAMQQRADALGQGNAQLDQLTGYLQKRYTDLQGPGYTGAENEVIRTGALDPIERDRQAARQQVITRLAQRNIRPGSGVYEAALQEVDKQFNAMRGTTQTQLGANELARREDRNSRAQTIAGQLADIPDARAREQLDVFSALNNLSQTARSEDEARQREALQYGGVLSDLGPQRLQLAMQAAGMGGNPESLGGLLTNVAQLNQTGQAYNAQNSNGMWSGLGQLAAILSRQGQYGL